MGPNLNMPNAMLVPRSHGEISTHKRTAQHDSASAVSPAGPDGPVVVACVCRTGLPVGGPAGPAPRRLEPRGDGHATTLFVKTVFADPSLIGTNQAKVARTLAPLLKMNETELIQKLRR